MDQVQPYESGGWNYLDELHKFVDGGMEGEAFINSVSGIVNRVSHSLCMDRMIALDQILTSNLAPGMPQPSLRHWGTGRWT